MQKQIRKKNQKGKIIVTKKLSRETVKKNNQQKLVETTNSTTFWEALKKKLFLKIKIARF